MEPGSDTSSDSSTAPVILDLFCPISLRSLTVFDVYTRIEEAARVAMAS